MDDDKVEDRGDNFVADAEEKEQEQEQEQEQEKVVDSMSDADPEDEDTETAEEKAEREKQEAEEERKRNIRIPKARFDEALNKAKAKERALLEEIQTLKGEKQSVDVSKAVRDMRNKIGELQDKYEDLILDGDRDAARKVRIEAEALREQLSDYQSNARAEAAREAAVETVTYDTRLAAYESKYPEINPEHDSFDQDKVDEVAMLLGAFIKAGHKRPKALDLAIKYVLGSVSSDDDRSTKREVDARKKAADASKRQPPDMKDVGIDNDKAGSASKSGSSVARMTQAQFAKLSEEELSKLRGDTNDT